MIDTWLVAVFLGSVPGDRLRRFRTTSRWNGQATAELAVVMPLIVALVALCLQLAGVALDQLAVDRMASGVARTTAVNGELAEREREVLRPSRLRSDDTDLLVRPNDRTVEVTVHYRSRVRLPFTNVTLVAPSLSARVVMWREQGG